MIVELINLLYDDAGISLHHPPKSFISEAITEWPALRTP
jgi:hypothetical protein